MSKSKRTVLISLYPPRGEKHTYGSGVASYTKNLATSFPPSENEIYVLANKIDRYEEYKEDGINIIRCFDRSSLACFARIHRALKWIQPDVVHIQHELWLFGGPINMLLLIWFLLRIRSYKPVITMHHVVSLRRVNREFIAQNFSTMPFMIARLGLFVIGSVLATLAGTIIVHEENFKEILARDYFKIPPEKIVVIPHGVEFREPLNKLEARRMLGIDPDRQVVLFVGYFSGYKGLDLLIEGFADYASHHPNALLVIGSGLHPRFTRDPKYLNEYQRLQKKAEALLTPRQLSWSGFIEEEDMIKLFSAADVSIYPYTISFASSGPMSIAVGYGCDIVASKEFAGHIPDELIFDHTPASLSATLNSFFEGGCGKHSFSHQLRSTRNWEAVARLHCEVYNRI